MDPIDEDRLDEYHQKRRFDRTPEPAGSLDRGATGHRAGDPADADEVTGPVAGPDGSAPARDDEQAVGRFVVQRHRARRLHYDLRLELDGVLVSWSVPKGPTLDPAVRRLAVRVEDHPVEYLDFEGVIPRGEYGGGDVIVWDRGRWRSSVDDDPRRQLAAGELHLELEGEKLHGRFMLLRTGRGRRDGDRSGGSGPAPGGRSGDKAQWLLFHKRDASAVDGWDPEDHPRSVRSGRTNDEVAAAPHALWRSDRPADRAEVALGGADDGEDGGRAGVGPGSDHSARAGEPGGSTSVGGRGPDARGPHDRAAEDGAEGASIDAPSGVDPSGGGADGSAAWTVPDVAGPTADELAALDALGDRGTWRLGGRDIALTNLDKVLFPPGPDGVPLTKRDLVRYHAAVAPALVPYLAGRPVNLQRFPDGVDRPGFWQKEVPGHAPAWLERWHDDEAGSGDTQWYLVPDGAPALAWLGNHAAVELHPWTSRLPDVRQPTWALIDIDPGPTTAFADVLVLARLYRTALDHLGVAGCPKVTGKRGVQIWVPVAPGYRFSDTRHWVERVSKAVGATVPDLVSWRWQKDEREGLARLDYTQNAINKTLVAPWSARPAPGAPVSVPLRWEELDDPDLRPDRWTIRTALDRLAEVGDPLRTLVGVAQRLPEL